MERIVAYTPLHYGCEYLRYAVASVADLVDRHIIMYSNKPSYGYGTTLKCPDTEEELRACVVGFPHVEWYTGEWHNEGDHRMAVMKYLKGNEILLPVDADEVWDRKILEWCIQNARARDNLVLGFVHFWRSFGWVCTDTMAPVRIINLKGQGVGYVQGLVYHFGYAQSVETITYKWAIHGHLGELRPGWLTKFITWHPGINDVHPTCENIWNPVPFDRNLLPPLMRNHPYYDLEIIAFLE